MKVGLEGFKAKSSWVNRFKMRNRIVSRKVTKFVTKKSLCSRDNVSQTCHDFVKDASRFIGIDGPDNYFNTDQSGFQLLLRSGRTLAFKGDRDVEAVTQSVTSLTHSYSTEYTISTAGKLLSPVYVVLEETGGDFGPIVKRSLFVAKNVRVSASTSGKLNKKHLQEWFGFFSVAWFQ